MTESIVIPALRPKAEQMTLQFRSFLSQLGPEGCEWVSGIGREFCNDLVELMMKHRPPRAETNTAHPWGKKGGAKTRKA